MNGGYSALINGIDCVGVNELATRLGDNDIYVFGIGESLPENDGGNIKLISNIGELSKKVEYVFDFVGDESVWKKAANDGSKLTLVSNNGGGNFEKLGRLKELGVNWRKVEVRGLYGPGMHRGDGGVEYLTQAIMLAVENKNLELPSAKKMTRLISVKEMVEAIMRATMLSSTEGGSFLVAGREITFERIASCLIDEAKMTKYKVLQKEISIESYDEDEVEKSWRALRWKPEGDFGEEIRETLQYYFSRADEEKRNPKKETRNKIPDSRIEDKRQSINNKRFEVMVEESEDEARNLILDSRDEEPEEVKLVFEKTVERIPVVPVMEVVDEEIEEEDEAVGRPIMAMGEIPNLMFKNSNLRPVGEKKETESKQVVLPPVVIQKVEKEVTRKKKVNKWPVLKLGAAIVMVGLLVVAAMAGYKVMAIVNGVKGVPELVKQKKYVEAENLASKVSAELQGADETVSEWGINRLKLGRNIQEVIRVLEGLVNTEKVGSELAMSGNNMFEAIFKDKEINWNSEMTKTQLNLGLVGSEIGVLQARLRGDWNWLPQKYKLMLNEAQKQLDETRGLVDDSGRIVSIMPELLGLDGKRREYLVLFQNESELRAGGGFIGSYGILSFESGKLLNLEIKDVYEADGQLKGHVEPPEEIKKYLGEANWYMRDANWQPSFVAQGKDLQWFLEKETGRKVDGVIGVDLAVAKAVLGVVGEIYVPDFKEKVNKNNLYEQAEFYSETNSFPGSNQKASFLGGVGKQLFESIKDLKQEQSFLLGKEILGLLKKNEIRVALNEDRSSKVMADMGWDGALYGGKCGVGPAPAGKCVADYLYVLESNFGVNKANYFIYRNIEQAVDISANSVGRVLRINYENTSKNKNWPGGDYKNYVRIYLPQEVNLAEVSLVETGKPETKNILTGDALKMGTVNGKKEVGFLVMVPVLKKITVEVRYSSGNDLSKTDKFSYLNYIQKQPGFGDTGLVTLVTFPDGWQPTQVEPVANLVGGKVLFNQKLEGDVKMGVEISK